MIDKCWFPTQSAGKTCCKGSSDDRNRLWGRKEQTLIRFTWNLTGNISAAETLRRLPGKHNLCPGLTPKTRESKIINECAMEAQCDAPPFNERLLSHHQSAATRRMATDLLEHEIKVKDKLHHNGKRKSLMEDSEISLNLIRSQSSQGHFEGRVNVSFFFQGLGNDEHKLVV